MRLTGERTEMCIVDQAPVPVSHVRGGFVRSFLEYRPAVFALMLIILLVIIVVLAPFLSPYGRDSLDLDGILAPPSAENVLGTDELGRDILTRLIHGGRFTLLVAFASVAIALVIGIVLGTVSGYIGGAADHAVTALIDLFLSIPVFLVLLIAASMGKGRLWPIPLVIGVTSWMEIARLVRAEFLTLRCEEYVDAARLIGSRHLTVVVRHILPNALPPVIVAVTVGFSQAMLIESALSFLGFGVQPPLPTWGNMLHNAQVFMRKVPAAAFAPGLMIFITCLSFHLIGDGLRRALAREHESS